VNVATGEVKTLVPVDSNSDGFLSVDVSPDGRRLAGVRDFVGSEVLEIFDLTPELEISLSKRFDKLTNAIDVRWTADSRDVLFRPSVNNPGPLYRLSVADGTTTRLSWIGPGASEPVVSAAGSRLIYTRNVRDTNIWRVALDTAARTIDKIAVSSFREVAPHYSPDGKRLAFHSNRSGSVQIWVANADGSQAVQRTTLDEFATTGTPRWSPDSRQIVFDSNAKDGYHLYVINADGGEPRPLTTGSTRNFVAWWSPDGRWVYFASDRSGQLNIWRVPPAGGTAEQVTHAGAEAPVVEGDWLYFTRAEGADGLWRQPVGGGPAERVLKSLFRYNYAVTSKGVYYVASPPRPDGASSVQFLDFATRADTTIAPIDARVDLGLAVSPDGKYLLFTKIDYLGADLMLVEKFR
jgi:Tol biopolymer transport system component